MTNHSGHIVAMYTKKEEGYYMQVLFEILIGHRSCLTKLIGRLKDVCIMDAYLKIPNFWNG